MEAGRGFGLALSAPGVPAPAGDVTVANDDGAVFTAPGAKKVHA